MKIFKNLFKYNQPADLENDRSLESLADRLAAETENIQIPGSIEPETLLPRFETEKPAVLTIFQRRAILASVSLLLTAVIITAAAFGFRKDETAPVLEVSSSASSAVKSEQIVSDEVISTEPVSSASVSIGTVSSRPAAIPGKQIAFAKPGARLASVYAATYLDIYKKLEPLKPNVYINTPPVINDEPGTGEPGTTEPNDSDSPHTNSNSDSSPDSDYGTTNTQVSDVDEADIIKNDGTHLYTLAGYNGEYVLNIIKPDAAGKLMLVSRLKVKQENFTPAEIYVKGNRLVITGTKHIAKPIIKPENPQQTEPADTVAIEPGIATDHCGEIYYGPTDSQIMIYNIADRKNPILERTFLQQGSNLRTRLIGDELYIVTTYYTGQLNLLTAENILDYVPYTVDSRFGRSAVPANRVALIPNVESASFAVITRLNIQKPDEKTLTEAALGAGNNIYASTRSLFLVSEKFSTDTPGYTSRILRFYIGENVLQCEAVGSVAGTILNNFSMDEYDLNFRIVTTDWNNAERSNDLHVLDHDLKAVGKISNIAPGETVKSVRFVGERGFVVTFLQIDPLFTLDLSDPKAPKITGELKIPGFSSYLHPLGENYLIGIGTAGEQTGAVYPGIKFSLFDVSNLKNPAEKHSFVLGGGNGGVSSTPVEYDYKSVMFDSKRGIMAVPCSLNGELSALVVLKVDSKAGFKQLALITHYLPAASNNPNGNIFQSWHDVDHVLRSTYIGDTFFTMSNGALMSLNSKNWTYISEIGLLESSIIRYRFALKLEYKGLISPFKSDVS